MGLFTCAPGMMATEKVSKFRLSAMRIEVSMNLYYTLTLLEILIINNKQKYLINRSINLWGTELLND
ncbi:MAG: hypothetical protein EPN88_15750 [Bacteroidetes bacterium]|nr:MAG: hypothetical protein EPN88_15750 [Bacteroidota bacterium]